jgi:hypothetical protein
MADICEAVKTTWASFVNITKRMKDMGDGTYAEVVYMGGGQITVQLGDIQLGSIQILGANGVDLAAVDSSGRFSFSLPAGAATEASLAQAVSALGNLVTSAAAASTAALQSAGNSSLASIDGKVATAAKQDTHSTKLDTIASNVAALTKPADVQQVAQSGVWTVGLTGAHVTIDNASLAVTGTFWQTTQPVSGTFWQSTQPVSIAASVAVTGPLTDTQLRASAIPVSAASLPLPSGAATATKQDSIITALGSPLQAGGSVAVSNFPAGFLVAQSGVWSVSISNFPATQPVSATTLPLPTGAASETGNLASVKTNTDKLDVALSTIATAARQDTGNATLASILADLALLLQTQGAAVAGVTGPMIQGAVSDTPAAQLDGMLAPLSLTSEGRLRVSMQQGVVSYFDECAFVPPSCVAAGPCYF